MNSELCPVCGADYKVWKEVFGEEHCCFSNGEKEPTLYTLLFITKLMLTGREGVDFSYYEHDRDWWELRLYTRIN